MRVFGLLIARVITSYNFHIFRNWRFRGESYVTYKSPDKIRAGRFLSDRADEISHEITF